MNVLGISCYFHDASAALLRDDELIAGEKEERFTRKELGMFQRQYSVKFSKDVKRRSLNRRSGIDGCLPGVKTGSYMDSGENC